MTTIPTKFDFDVWKGQTTTLQVNLTSSGGGAYDLTGQRVDFTVTWGSLQLSRSTDDPTVVIDDPTTGVIKVHFSAEETKTLPLGKVVKYELTVTNGQTVDAILYGFLNVQGWS